MKFKFKKLLQRNWYLTEIRKFISIKVLFQISTQLDVDAIDCIVKLD